MSRRAAWGLLAAVLAVLALGGLYGVVTLADALSQEPAGYLSPVVASVVTDEAKALAFLGAVLVALVLIGACGATAAGRRALAASLLVGVMVLSAGCGTLGLGGKESRLGDGQIDLVRLLAIVGGVQSGDPTPLCEAVLAGQAGRDETTAGLLLAACRGLLGQIAPQSSPFAASSVVAGSAVPPGGACDDALAEVQLALDLAANACGGRQ